MNNQNIQNILSKVKNQEIETHYAAEMLQGLILGNVPNLNFDHNRADRTGLPEVIFCKNKSVDQLKQIFEQAEKSNTSLLGTKLSEEKFIQLKDGLSTAKYNAVSQTLICGDPGNKSPHGHLAVVSAGTSDQPIVEEAVVTADFMGNNVKTFTDVGVAGIHRLFDRIEQINKANVIIVVAGMEGALASVIAGLTTKPVIAVPTSVGYGANFQGLAPLLAMLNSCAPGVSVVNIDNGFGAACQASLINQLITKSIKQYKNEKEFSI